MIFYITGNAKKKSCQIYVTTNSGGKNLNTCFADNFGHGKTPISVSIKCRKLFDEQKDCYLPKNESTNVTIECLKLLCPVQDVPASGINSCLESFRIFLTFFHAKCPDGTQTRSVASVRTL